jgi:TIR domain
VRIRYRIQTKVTVRREVRYRATLRYLPSSDSPPAMGRAQALPSLPARTVTSVIRTPAGGNGSELLYVEAPSPELAWDVFICHASEDKATIVRDLARELAALGVSVWLDETVMHIGDSLRQRIDHGLAHSRFGAVVLSHAFFGTKKRWTHLELDALVTLEMSGRQRILPIWHNLSSEDILSYSPTLAGKVAAKTSESSVGEIAAAIAEIVRPAR